VGAEIIWPLPLCNNWLSCEINALDAESPKIQLHHCLLYRTVCRSKIPCKYTQVSEHPTGRVHREMNVFHIILICFLKKPGQNGVQVSCIIPDPICPWTNFPIGMVPSRKLLSPYSTLTLLKFLIVGWAVPTRHLIPSVKGGQSPPYINNAGVNCREAPTATFRFHFLPVIIKNNEYFQLYLCN